MVSKLIYVDHRCPVQSTRSVFKWKINLVVYEMKEGYWEVVGIIPRALVLSQVHLYDARRRLVPKVEKSDNACSRKSSLVKLIYLGIEKN